MTEQEAIPTKRRGPPAMPLLAGTAATSDLAAMIEACAAAGWALRVKYLGPDSVYRHRVELRLQAWEEGDDGGPSFEALPAGGKVLVDPPMSYYWQIRHELHVTGNTLPEALDALSEAIVSWGERPRSTTFEEEH